MTTVGVIVAAGASTRMGEPKALLEIGDRPMLQWVVDAAEASAVSEVVVVTGHYEEQIRAAVRLGRAVWAHNPDPSRGTMSSLRAALEVASPADALVKLVADQPEIDPAAIDALIGAFDPDRHDTGLVRYRDGDGHPMLVVASALDQLGEGDRLLWRLIEDRPARVVRVPWDAPRPLDVNEWDDYQAVAKRLTGRP